MKNCTFITLLLSAALTLPAIAQSNSGGGAPPAATHTGSVSSAASSSQPSSQAGERHDFWDGDDPGVAWLVFHPFASKEYVRRHVQSVRDRVNELDELTASNQKMIRDVDARAQQGIQMASAKASMADDHANDATNKAQTAQQTATALNARVTTEEKMVGSLDQYKAGAQTEIRFRPGQSVLSKQAKDALDEIAAQVKSQHGYILEVQGFSSGQGQAAIANSRKMADSVVRYMVLTHDIPAYRIFVIGMGNTSAEKRGGGTRVEISLLKNELAQTASK
jgi:outer membrane protein OmpA-like peptidoglycan-associated protein